MVHRLEDIKSGITRKLSGSPFEVMELALMAGGGFIFIDFLVDFFIIHQGRSLIYILNMNLTPASLWSNFLIVSCFVLSGYLFTVYREGVKKDRESFDGYISETIKALDVLRYNLYSMRMVLHSSNNDMTPPAEALNSVEEGISASISLIDSYLEDIG